MLGLIVHPFFFAFHLSDFLRISLLKNVIKAIYIPREQLILTYMVFFILKLRDLFLLNTILL